MDAEVITIFYSNLVETASTDSANLNSEWILDNINWILGISFILAVIGCYSSLAFQLFCLNIWLVVAWFFIGISILMFLIVGICTNPVEMIFNFFWFFIPLGFILYWFAKSNPSTLGWIFFMLALIMVLPFIFNVETDGNEVEKDEENEDGDSITLVILE